MNIDIAMLVCWKQQRRIIHVKSEDDFKTIERLISESYALQQTNLLQEMQIQYYDQCYQTFIDLCPQTMGEFRKLIDKLSRMDAPEKNKKIWRLRLIPRNFPECQIDQQESVLIRTSISTDSPLEPSQAVVPSDSPINLHFDTDINDRQRKQYESDLTRNGNSTK